MTRAHDLSSAEAALLEGFEERADHVTEDVLRQGTVKGDYFDKVHESLMARGLVLVQGPRGCGKTHMMRYTWLLCRDSPKLPLAIYVTFNRYLRLEPLLRKRPDALTLFQAWTLCRILQAADELSSQHTGAAFDVAGYLDLNRDAINTLVSRLERGASISEKDDKIVQAVTIERVADTVEAMCDHYGRKRAVVLLDDAALTLTPEYLVEFFDIVRVMKRPKLSPKASVYPGTTEFGPRFHASHEGKTVVGWLSVDNPAYKEIMRGIATHRYPESGNIPDDVQVLLMYVAFGVPRAYLAMLREWQAGGFTTEQQGTNKIVQAHNEARRQEFMSLALKMPRFATLVKTGEMFFNKVVEAVRHANESLAEKSEKQIVFGLETAGLDVLLNRMINLLIEAGLLFEQTQVSHGGPDRTYRRLIPHFSSLVAVRAFSGKSRGGQARQIVEFLSRPLTKHPVRRKVDSVLDAESLSALRLDLPACQVCSTPRLSESQKFCHACGSKLVDDSTFTRCMDLSFDEVPHLTKWARQRLKDHDIRKIGDLMTLQDPGTELRKIYMVGAVRAERIVTAVESYVDEFLS